MPSKNTSLPRNLRSSRSQIWDIFGSGRLRRPENFENLHARLLISKGKWWSKPENFLAPSARFGTIPKGILINLHRRRSGKCVFSWFLKGFAAGGGEKSCFSWFLKGFCRRRRRKITFFVISKGILPPKAAKILRFWIWLSDWPPLIFWLILTKGGGQLVSSGLMLAVLGDEERKRIRDPTAND